MLVTTCTQLTANSFREYILDFLYHDVVCKTVVVLGVLFLAFDLSIYRGILLKMLLSSTRNKFFFGNRGIGGGTIGGFQESILSLVEKPCGLLQARNQLVYLEI